MIKIFKLPHNTVADVSRDIETLRNAVKPYGDAEYVRLFCGDAVNVVDNIALNVIPRPNEALFGGLIQELDRKINLAIAAKFPTKYNISITASVVARKSTTYILVSGEGDFWDQAFQDVELKELKKKDADALLESNLTIAFSKQLYPNGNINILDEDMKFDSVERRAAVQARYRVQNDLLKCVAAGKEIQNFQVNEYYDEILELLNKESVQVEMSNLKKQLEAILPVITPELIKLTPQELNDLAQQRAAAKLNSTTDKETDDSTETN